MSDVRPPWAEAWPACLRSGFGLSVLAGAGSAGLLVAALLFQYVGGLHPCDLCIIQRWPHVVAMALVPAVLTRWKLAPVAGAGTMAVSAGLGVWHVGVEQGWWSGPEACSGAGDISALSSAELLDQIMGSAAVSCDIVAWELFGISMAGWNVVASVGLAAVWLLAAFAGPFPGWFGRQDREDGVLRREAP